MEFRRLLQAVIAVAVGLTVAGSATAQESDSDGSGAGMAFSFLPRVYTLAPGQGTGHRVLILYAVPGRRLQAGSGHSDEALRARVRLSRIDVPADTVVVTDTLKSMLELGSGREIYAVGFEELALVPGRYDFRLYLGAEDGRIGLEASLPPVTVDDLAEAPLWLSDLVLGRLGSGVAWLRDGELIHINPLNTYRQGSSIEVYYEVVGLAEGTPFETIISLTPVRAYNPVVEESLDPLVSFGYDEVARSRFTPLRRTLSLGDFPPGRYRLAVTARKDSLEVERVASIRVLAP